MDVLGIIGGQVNKDTLRVNRIKNILKDNQQEDEEMKREDIEIEKDDAKFIQLHLQHACPKYHMYFGDYNTEMFQKLCPSMWFKEYQKDDVVYSKDDPAKFFYFILKGTVHVLETDSKGDQKIAKLHNENEVFGLNKGTADATSQLRTRDCVAETETNILKIDAEEYEKIRSQRVLSAAESKIEFLTRYIPGLRSVDIKIIQDLESLFQKEKVTKGYRLLEQGVVNDYLYFIYSGECRILYNYNSNSGLKKKFDSLNESLLSYLLIGKLSEGQ